jgi:hypothetical protein
MADERTVSTFSWLNSALRNRQDVATVVRQTQIRQYYGWDEVVSSCFFVHFTLPNTTYQHL